jgi:hypothetical protein
MLTVRADAGVGSTNVVTEDVHPPQTVVTGWTSGTTSRTDATGASQGTTTQRGDAGGTMKR